MKRPVVALMYDFDKTLCTKDMQEYGFIPSLGMSAGEFWCGVDGLTDVPCMKLVKTNGGQSIAVYGSQGEYGAASSLLAAERVNYVAPADYTEGSRVDTLVKAIIRKIQAESEMLSYIQE